MPLPLSDVTQAYRSAPEKTDLALTKVRGALCCVRLSCPHLLLHISDLTSDFRVIDG